MHIAEDGKGSLVVLPFEVSPPQIRPGPAFEFYANEDSVC
jgi:hypothetical protein